MECGSSGSGRTGSGGTGSVAETGSTGTEGGTGTGTGGSGGMEIHSPGHHPVQSLMAGAGGGGRSPKARFSRKVFVGGLPPDSDAEELMSFFGYFGRCWVDWPHKAETGCRFPPKGYAFVVYEAEMGVRRLLESCSTSEGENGKLYIGLSSPSVTNKPVQVRPWLLADAEYKVRETAVCDPRKTVFVGGVPRPLRACDLGHIFNNYFGGVCYAGIDVDTDLNYPKGAGRVTFDNLQSYHSAIMARYVFIQHPEASKRVEVKPYVLDEQVCDECSPPNRRPAPYFCPQVCCLSYYCEDCWLRIHKPGGKYSKDFHKPLVKEPGLSSEFQKLHAGQTDIGGILRSGFGSGVPPSARRLPHVRPANISPVTGRRLPPPTQYRDGERMQFRDGGRPRSAIFPAPVSPTRQAGGADMTFENRDPRQAMDPYGRAVGQGQERYRPPMFDHARSHGPCALNELRKQADVRHGLGDWRRPALTPYFHPRYMRGAQSTGCLGQYSEGRECHGAHYEPHHILTRRPTQVNPGSEDSSHPLRPIQAPFAWLRD